MIVYNHGIGDWFFASFAFIAFIAFVASEIEFREWGIEFRESIIGNRESMIVIGDM